MSYVNSNAAPQNKQKFIIPFPPPPLNACPSFQHPPIPFMPVQPSRPSLLPTPPPPPLPLSQPPLVQIQQPAYVQNQVPPKSNMSPLLIPGSWDRPCNAGNGGGWNGSPLQSMGPSPVGIQSSWSQKSQRFHNASTNSWNLPQNYVHVRSENGQFSSNSSSSIQKDVSHHNQAFNKLSQPFKINSDDQKSSSATQKNYVSYPINASYSNSSTKAGQGTSSRENNTESRSIKPGQSTSNRRHDSESRSDHSSRAKAGYSSRWSDSKSSSSYTENCSQPLEAHSKQSSHKSDGAINVGNEKSENHEQDSEVTATHKNYVSYPINASYSSSSAKSGEGSSSRENNSESSSAKSGQSSSSRESNSESSSAKSGQSTSSRRHDSESRSDRSSRAKVGCSIRKSDSISSSTKVSQSSSSRGYDLESRSSHCSGDKACQSTSSKRDRSSRHSRSDNGNKDSRSRGRSRSSERRRRHRSSSSRHHSPDHKRPRYSSDRARHSSGRHKTSGSHTPHFYKRPRSESPEDNKLLQKEASWIRSSHAELYYMKNDKNSKVVTATEKLKELHETFKYELVDRADRTRAMKPKYNPPQRRTKLRNHKPKMMCGSDHSSSSEKSSSDEEDTAMEELEKKRKHPDRLHPELWFNDPKEMNDGPLCRCSAKARRSGIRHGIYVGEDSLSPCQPYSNNASRLHHYRITMKPHTNFLTKCPTTILHHGHKYVFEGFSMFSHTPLPKLPDCKVIRFNYEYSILYVEEPFPENFTVAGLELFTKYLLNEVLELVDLNWKAHNDETGCSRFHFMPRFARELENDGKELLSLNEILQYLLNSNKILIDESCLTETLSLSTREWQNMADKVKGMIVTCPGMKPSSVRVDQLDREVCEANMDTFPVIVHFGVRPPQLSYAGNPYYQKAWRDYVKYRHLLANKPKVKYADRHKLLSKEMKLQEMRMENDLKRDVTVVISSRGFYKTGIMSDVIQHAMVLPVLVCHLRFHESLNKLEEKIGYKFTDRFLLQLALTHPSYRENFGTNPDHARNSLTNCGLRQPQYGDRRIHYMNTRKRGINTLINIMSRFGSPQETMSSINHNERLEFLGDAVVEFLSSIHLYFMFPDLEEGGLATYRAAIVQNQHLAVLSRKLELEKFMLYAHGSDLCHDLELRHAMANCFEALMGALFLDDGIEIADKVFSETLFPEPELLEVWVNYPLHPLQEQEPEGDRKWIESVPLLQKLHKFEEDTGIEFTHIRLLARALTHRSLGYNNLTLGSNQRMEFLGDTVLQLVASEYLYKFFPEHHEGHLSLLRSSLVNNRTQAVVCGDLGMAEYAIYPRLKVELKTKDRADLLEAFLGALYVDKGLGYCRKFCEVCFFPRLQDFIMNQDWNDPKSKLQQCCLTLRSMDGGEPDIPVYKVIESKGPTNTRVYSVAVYFQGNRLAKGTGHSIQQAEMDAASNALKNSKGLFPQLKHQKRAIERSLKQGTPSSTVYIIEKKDYY